MNIEKLTTPVNYLILLILLSIYPTLSYGIILTKEHAIQRNNLSIALNNYYEDHLPSSAPRILLVHGLTYSSHVFDVNIEDYSLARFLAKNGFNVWSIDITGYGESEKPKSGYNINASYAAKDISKAIQYIRGKCNCKKIDLLGWSWGTITSTKVANEHPEWINKLVLYAPLHRGQGYKKIESGWHHNSWKDAANDFQKSSDGSINSNIVKPAVAATYLSNCWRYDGDKSPSGGRRDIFQDKDTILFNEKGLTMPVLMLGGSHDPFLDWSDLDKTFNNLPDQKASKLIKIEGASHVMMLEEPYYHRLQKSILNFLK